ncbi:MAG: vitamin K epoxide reductase family protein [Chloroflexi bacterium]|nr:vitamin K epoxide reductase family protein [Chloroflexota bacterium]
MTTEIQRESKLDWMLVGWWLAVVCAVIGLADSIYLTWLKLSGELAACGGIGDCESVNVSIYSQINGVPIALLGAGAYFLMLLFLFLESRDDFIGDWSPMIVFGLSLTGTLYSIYLTYIEIAVLKAICPYCVLSAVAVLIIFVISIARLRRSHTH